MTTLSWTSFSTLEQLTLFSTDMSFCHHGYQGSCCLGDKMVQEFGQIVDVRLPPWIQAKVHQVRGRNSYLLEVGCQPVE